MSEIKPEELQKYFPNSQAKLQELINKFNQHLNNLPQTPTEKPKQIEKQFSELAPNINFEKVTMPKENIGSIFLLILGILAITRYIMMIQKDNLNT
jgi:hypothetical protein